MVLLAQSVVLGRVVLNQMQRLATASTDNVEWTLAQIEVDLLRLQNTMDRVVIDGPEELEQLRRRFDIFYSRYAIIADSPVYAEFRTQPGIPERIAHFKRFLDLAVPFIDGSDQALLDQVPNLRARTEHLHPDIRGLALDGIGLFADSDEITRGDISQTLLKLGLSALALITILAATIVFLLRMYTRIRTVSQENELMRTRFEAMVNSSLDAILVIDTDGNIIAFNGAAEQVFGHKQADVLGQNMSDLIVPEHLRAAHVAGMKRFLESGEKRVIGAGRVRLEALHKSGHVFPTELSIDVANNGDQTVFVSFLRDISQQVADEEELVRARDEAQAGEKAKAELLTVMSHEMRTPLNGILGSLELIDRDSLKPGQTRYLDAIGLSGDLLLSHVNNVLDLSRNDATAITPKTQTVSLPDLVNNVVKSQIALSEVQNNTISIHLIPEDIGSVIGDENRLKQCLINLLGNATKFTTNGTVTLEVERLAEGDLVEFRISDTGVGIAEEDLSRIFEAFVTIDTGYSREFSGTGLGLAITQQLITAMGGELEADSIEGEGSLFTMRLPLPPTQAPSLPKPVVQTKASISPAGTTNALVVDDNEINRLIAAEMLRNRGFTVDEAHGGQSAIQMAEAQAYDLILMDISMPGVDGIEALQSIRAGAGPNKATRIVALTAHAATEDQERIKSAGFRQIITKPLSRQSITQLLDTPMTPVPNDIGDQDRAHSSDAKTQAIKILGRERYQAALDQFHIEMDAFATLLQLAEHPTPAARAQAHALYGSAAVLGLQAQWQTLSQLEGSDEASWPPLRAQLLKALKTTTSTPAP